MLQERLCRDVLGEDVRGDLDYPHKIMLHQLLDEEVLEFNVFCYL